MAKYGVFLDPNGCDQMTVATTTEATPADGDWDTAGAVINFKLAVKSIWVYEDGSDLHIATQQFNGRVAYHIFDPGTNAFTLTDELVAEEGDTDFDVRPTHPAVSLALRADGDVVLVAAYEDSSGNQSLRCFARESAVWTNKGEASGDVASTDYVGVSMVGPDASDRISWAYGDITNLDVDLRSINSTNTISAVTEIDATTDIAKFLVAPGLIDDNDKIYMPYLDGDNRISFGSWTSGATPSVSLDTTLTVRDVIGQERGFIPVIAACMALESTTDAHLVYYDDATGDIVHEDDVDGAVASDTQIEDLDDLLTGDVGVTTLYAWGDGASGRSGLSITSDVSSPVQVESDTDWGFNFEGGLGHAAAVKSDGTLWSWCDGAFGHTGQSDTTDRSSPSQVGSDTDWERVICGLQHMFAIKTDGRIYTNGESGFGQLGLGAGSGGRSSPSQVGSGTDWGSVGMAGGDESTHIIKQNGELWGWGRTEFSALGNGTTTPNISSPVQIGSDTDWVNISSGQDFSLAVKSNGQLWTWGTNLDGQLGQGDTTARSAPIQIGSLTDWSGEKWHLCAAGSSSYNIKVDGTLWAWGRGDLGQQGDGTFSDNNSPVQIGSDTDWASIQANASVIVATKKNGTLWTWGFNAQGALGQNNPSGDVNSPVQVGTDTDWLVGVGSQSFCHAIKRAGARSQRISARVIT